MRTPATWQRPASRRVAAPRQAPEQRDPCAPFACLSKRATCSTGRVATRRRNSAGLPAPPPRRQKAASCALYFFPPELSSKRKETAPMNTCPICGDEYPLQTRSVLWCFNNDTNTDCYVCWKCVSETMCCRRRPRPGIDDRPSPPPNLILTRDAAGDPRFTHRVCPI